MHGKPDRSCAWEQFHLKSLWHLLPHTTSCQCRLQHQKELAAAAGIGKITFHQPYVSSWGTHHSKAFFLEYATGVRIIIHTANLVHGDCTYKSQAVWFQDFPWKVPETFALLYVAACSGWSTALLPLIYAKHRW